MAKNGHLLIPTETIALSRVRVSDAHQKDKVLTYGGIDDIDLVLVNSSMIRSVQSRWEFNSGLYKHVEQLVLVNASPHRHGETSTYYNYYKCVNAAGLICFLPCKFQAADPQNQKLAASQCLSLSSGFAESKVVTNWI